MAIIDSAKLSRLSEKDRLVLEFYAYIGNFINFQRYDRDLVKFLGIDWKGMSAIQAKLRDRGLLREGWYSHSITMGSMVGVLAYMAQHHPGDAKLLSRIVTNDRPAAFYASVEAAVNGKTVALPEAVQTDDVRTYASYSVEYPWCTYLLDAFSSTARLDIATSLVRWHEIVGASMPPEMIDRLFTTYSGDSALAENLADYKSLYMYVHDGICCLPTTNSASRPYQQMLRGIRCANMGEYEAALSHFAAALKVLNRTQIVKNVFFDPITAYYMVMSYVHVGTPSAATKLRAYTNKKDISSIPTQLVGVILADAFLSESRMPSNVLLNEAMRETYLGQPAVNVRALGMMAAKYYGISDTSKAMKALSLDYAIIRHELSDYLPLDEQERAMLRDMYGDKPALTSIEKKQKWEWAIEDVIKDIDDGASKSDGKKEAKDRIIYMIGKHTKLLVPYTQAWLKSGRWGMPKQVTRKKFNDHAVAGMDKTDMLLAAAMPVEASYRGTTSIEFPSVFDVAHLLIGSDRVFLESSDGMPGEQVVFDEAEPYLQVKKDASRGEIKVSSNIDLADLERDRDNVTIKNSSTSYSVCKITPKIRSVYRRLLTLGAFPFSAEENVKHMLTRLEEISEVRSPLLDSKSIPQLEGSSLIAARVAPASGMAYRVEFMAKPAAEGACYVVPGEGRAVVYDMIDGKNVRVKRDLKGEAQAMADLLDQISDLAELSDGSNVMQLGVDSMLDVIDFAQESPERLQVEWTEGKALSLSKATQSSVWNAGLKSKGDWFEVEGELRLSDGMVMSMTQLLSLIAASRGRYVRLSDTDYIEISGKLRKQLSRLEAVTVQNHNKTMVSALNAALLDDKVLDGEIKFAFSSRLADMRRKIADSMEQPVEVPAMLNAQLRPYQVDGFQWMARLASWGAGACLADDMGLGKTVQTIAFLLLKAAQGPALVVAPSSVVPNWLSEIERFAPTLKATVLNKVADRAELLAQTGAGDVVISTYGILNTEIESVGAKEWATVVLDEAHTIKNRATKMSAAVMQLKANNRIILTGTPIQNHLGELWNLFRFINPGLLGSFDSFRSRFVTPIQDGDKERQHALQRIIKPFMLRRTKGDVIDDLPEKTDVVMPIELSDREMAMYEAIRQQAAEAIEADDKVSVNTLAELTKLRRAACSMALVDKQWSGPDSKTQAFIDMVQDFKGTSNRMLVFSQFTSYLALVRQALDKAGIDYLYLDGSTPMKERERMVKEFRTGSATLFLISLKAGGLGLNLPEANYVAHLDPWWNPAIEQQATDRAYRIGQKRNVTVYHFVAKNTIEEKMRRLHRTKRDLADSLLEGSDMAAKLTLADVIALVSTPDSVE